MIDAMYDNDGDNDSINYCIDQTQQFTLCQHDEQRENERYC